MIRYLFSLIIGTLLLTGCSPKNEKQYKIGVSQCSEDIWRDKQNAELRVGAYLHENVQLCFAVAYDSDERQIQQIDSLVAEGIDLLIVAPNQVQTISPAIDRAYDQGIPVIVFERKTSSQKYTAFISADNYEMGRVMGEYIVSRLHGKGNVLEIKGLEGSSPAIERHNGFMDAVKQSPGINIVGSLQGDWTEPTAEETVSLWLAEHPGAQVDLVFGANDRTAMGARKAFMTYRSSIGDLQGANATSLPLFCGVDGLPGKDGGISLVRDSILEASYIYPTHGDKLLQLAVDILEGKPYQKETLMMSALITRDNATVLYMQGEEIIYQAMRLESLHKKADNYLKQLNYQRTISLLALVAIGLLILVMVLSYLYRQRKKTLQRQKVVNTLWNIEPPAALPQQEESTVKSEQAEVKPQGTNVADSLFISRFREVVEQNLADSNISVEDLATQMNLSRVQLYRKVKAISGSSPVELLRTARLNRGYQLLITTDKTVSEIAYEVGFTAPSYFTKCFKEEFGLSPSDMTHSS